ncbi:transposase [Streptomyces werraensis]|uniref:transposase n=1 Tax=Streptomyces werraensis TaxID=68284 RepID=UPI003F4C636C
MAPPLPPAPERRRRHPGRAHVPDRVALAGVLFVLRTGVAWRDVPAETMGCSGATACRRLPDWTEAGAWPRLHAVLLTDFATPTCWTWMTARWTARMSGPSKDRGHLPVAQVRG